MCGLVRLLVRSQKKETFMRTKMLYSCLLIFSFLYGAVSFIQADDAGTINEVIATGVESNTVDVGVTDNNLSITDEAVGIDAVVDGDWHQTLDNWYTWLFDQAAGHPYLSISGLAAFMGTLFYMLSNVLRNEAVVEAVKREMIKKNREQRELLCDCVSRGCACLVKGNCPCGKDRKGCSCSNSYSWQKGMMKKEMRRFCKWCHTKKRGVRLVEEHLSTCPFLKVLMNLLKDYEDGCPYLRACMNK